MGRNKKILKYAGLILIVIAVISAIVVVVILKDASRRSEKALKASVENEISTIALALDMYKLDHGIYPTTDQGILILAEKTIVDSNKTYLPDKGFLKDYWGNDYDYRYPINGTSFQIISYGADGKAGGKGVDMDITVIGGDKNQ